MDLHDWLLFLHLVAAFVLVAALVALWAIVFATGGKKPALPNDGANRIGKIAGPMVGAGMTVALIFGIWLSFEIDGYHVWDAWIVAAIIIWAIAAAAGGKSGQLFSLNDGSKRAAAVQLQIVNTVGVVLILILMIWKPGA